MFNYEEEVHDVAAAPEINNHSNDTLIQRELIDNSENNMRELTSVFENTPHTSTDHEVLQLPTTQIDELSSSEDEEDNVPLSELVRKKMPVALDNAPEEKEEILIVRTPSPGYEIDEDLLSNAEEVSPVKPVVRKAARIPRVPLNTSIYLAPAPIPSRPTKKELESKYFLRDAGGYTVFHRALLSDIPDKFAAMLGNAIKDFSQYENPALFFRMINQQNNLKINLLAQGVEYANPENLALLLKEAERQQQMGNLSLGEYDEFLMGRIDKNEGSTLEQALFKILCGLVHLTEEKVTLKLQQTQRKYQKSEYILTEKNLYYFDGTILCLTHIPLNEQSFELLNKAFSVNKRALSFDDLQKIYTLSGHLRFPNMAQNVALLLSAIEQRGDAEYMKKLLFSLPKDENFSLLAGAAIHGQQNTFTTLLSHMLGLVDKNIITMEDCYLYLQVRDKKDFTPLMFLARCEHHEALQSFYTLMNTRLSREDYVSLLISPNKYGLTVLHLILKSQMPLVEDNDTPPLLDAYLQEVVGYADDEGSVQLHLKHERQLSPLLFVLRWGSDDMVKAYLSHLNRTFHRGVFDKNKDGIVDLLVGKKPLLEAMKRSPEIIKELVHLLRNCLSHTDFYSALHEKDSENRFFESSNPDINAVLMNARREAVEELADFFSLDEQENSAKRRKTAQILPEAKDAKTFPDGKNERVCSSLAQIPEKLMPSSQTIAQPRHLLSQCSLFKRQASPVLVEDDFSDLNGLEAILDMDEDGIVAHLGKLGR